MPFRTVREATFDVLRQTGLMRLCGEVLPALADRQHPLLLEIVVGAGEPTAP